MGAEKNCREKLHILELDLSETDGIARMIKETCDIFFHLGWDGSGSENRKKEELQFRNVENGERALLGARSLGCRRFVFSGSQAEYGTYQTAVTEDTECRPVSAYGKAKAEFGRRAREICDLWAARDNFRMEYVHVRIFSVYGTGDHPWSLVNTCLDTFLKNGRMELGACTQQWNYLYIDDLVKGMLALALQQKPESTEGVYNLAGGRESTRPLREYVEIMHRLCGGRGSCVYGQLPPNAEGLANLMPDIGKLQDATGWKPEISFEDGIKRMLEIKNKKCQEAVTTE